jgi:hypothetical protein
MIRTLFRMALGLAIVTAAPAWAAAASTFEKMPDEFALRPVQGSVVGAGRKVPETELARISAPFVEEGMVAIQGDPSSRSAALQVDRIFSSRDLHKTAFIRFGIQSREASLQNVILDAGKETFLFSSATSSGEGYVVVFQGMPSERVRALVAAIECAATSRAGRSGAVQRMIARVMPIEMAHAASPGCGPGGTTLEPSEALAINDALTHDDQTGFVQGVWECVKKTLSGVSQGSGLSLIGGLLTHPVDTTRAFVSGIQNLGTVIRALADDGLGAAFEQMYGKRWSSLSLAERRDISCKAVGFVGGAALTIWLTAGGGFATIMAKLKAFLPRLPQLGIVSGLVSRAETVQSVDGAGAAQGTVSAPGVAVVITPAVKTQWAAMLSRLKSVAAEGKGGSSQAAINQILKDGVDDVVKLPEQMPMEAARAKLTQLEMLEASGSRGSLSAETIRKIEHARRGLADYVAGSTTKIHVEPVTLRDGPLLGLTMENPVLRANMATAFEAELDRSLAALAPADQVAMLRTLARSAGWENGLEIPAEMKGILISNNEWSTFAGNVSYSAMERLARVGTPEAYAEIALQSPINVRTSYPLWVSEKSRELLSQASPGTFRRALEIARKSASKPPYSNDASWSRRLVGELDKIEKAGPGAKP